MRLNDVSSLIGFSYQIIKYSIHKKLRVQIFSKQKTHKY